MPFRYLFEYGLSNIKWKFRNKGFERASRLSYFQDFPVFQHPRRERVQLRVELLVFLERKILFAMVQLFLKKHLFI